MTQLDPDIIMIVDSLNLSFRYLHEKKKDFLDSYLRTVESLRKSYRAGKVIIACDSGNSSYRKAILPEYKASRKLKYENQTPQEAEDFQQFFEEFNRIIDVYKECDDYPVLRFPGVEADDIGAYIVKKCPDKKIWLMSTDRDWDLLVGENVSRFSYVTRKEITLDNWYEHYEYDPEDHISIKCLMGDGGDDVPGVNGIGPKKAYALVKEYGTTYDIIVSLPIKSKYKHIQALNEFGANNLLRNYKLMDLLTYCDEALGPDNCKEINKVLENYVYNAS